MKAKITKELVESLSSDKITKKEYDRIVALITDKANEIWRFICEAAGIELDWWAFRNDMSYGHGNGSSGGEFDPETDKEFIEITGDRSYVDDCPFNEGFPTEYLWMENYRDVVVEEIEKAEKKAKEAKAKKKLTKAESAAKRKEIQDQIRTKLSKEELKHIQFKK
ncbi:MAG: hypothetical protein M0R80_25735 [Proteobacteria bacterium]|jgi:hypothetical protein|nr:hypothetical protein [Pseudomonadota bacterium]